MTPTPESQALRVTIAEADGWYDFGTTAPERGSLTPRVIGRNKERMDRRVIPNYPESRDAIVSAVLRKFRTFDEKDAFRLALLHALGGSGGHLDFALATADALTLSKAYVAAAGIRVEGGL